MKPSLGGFRHFLALRVVCYEALTGRKPFARKSDAETSGGDPAAHSSARSSELNPLVTQMVSRVIHKAMAKEPWHRFSTAREYRRDAAKGAAQRSDRTIRSRQNPAAHRTRRRRRSRKATQFASEILTRTRGRGEHRSGNDGAPDPDRSGHPAEVHPAAVGSARARGWKRTNFRWRCKRSRKCCDVDEDNAERSACARRSRSSAANGRSRTGFGWWISTYTTCVSAGAARAEEILKISPTHNKAARNFWWKWTGGKKRSAVCGQKRSNSTNRR